MKIKLTIVAVLIAVTAYAQVPRWNLATLTPHNDGGLTAYRFFATEEWHKTPFMPNGSLNYDGAIDLPDRDEKWPLLVYYADGSLRVLYYYEKRFRVPRNAAGDLGSVQRNPIQWAYIRLAEDTWDGSRWVVPGVEAKMPPKLSLVYTIPRLMSEYPKKAIMDEMDKYPGLDGPGAPDTVSK